MFINTGRIYLDAIRWVNEVNTVADDLAPGQPQALASIIFAALSVEAFINEIVLQAEAGTSRRPNSTLRTFADVLGEMEQSRAPITSKIMMGKFILSGESFDKGKNPFQDFALLVKLRNEIVHQKAFEEFSPNEQGNYAMQRRSILEPFKNRGVLARTTAEERNEEILTNWLDDISTRAMAVWACSAAHGILNSMLDAAVAADSGSLARGLEFAYRDAFKPVAQQRR
jgi:hypothetical protein